MGQKKRRHRKRKRHKSAERERQLFLQRGILAAGMVLLAVIVCFFIANGIRKGRKEETASSNDVEDMLDFVESEESGTSKAQQTQETEEIVIAAEVGDMDDQEDQQAVWEEADSNQDGEIVTDDVLGENDYEQSGVSRGIDVAKWQGTIDWQQVRDAGVDFAIIRVGYRTMKTGLICEDPLAAYNLQQAQAAGIKLGVYFFSTAVSEQEAKEEAAWVASFVARYPITYPVAFNCEGFKSQENRQYGLSQAQRTDLAIAFMNYISAQGYTPMFYASKNEMEGNALWDMDKLEGKYKIWVSQYPDQPYPDTAKSDYTGTHDMWQYTSHAQVPCVPKGADMNVAYFGYSQIAEPKDPTPPEVAEADPEALIVFTEVDETVTAKIETNLRSLPSTQSDETIVAKLKNGETVQRTGIGHNGWSRVIYDGQKLYAVSSYLTTDLSGVAEASSDGQDAQEPSDEPGDTTIQDETQDEDESGVEDQEPDTEPQEGQQAETNSIYKAVNEPVTAKNNTNLRSTADSSDPGNIVGTLKYGEVAVRTGVGSNGWSCLEYNGQTVYAISSYLTTDGNYKENNTPSLANPEAGITFTAVQQLVTAKIETNLRNLPTTLEPSSVIATLKNGETATRTGVGSNGWSRLEYNGQTVYAVSSYLTLAE